MNRFTTLPDFSRHSLKLSGISPSLENFWGVTTFLHIIGEVPLITGLIHLEMPWI